VTALPGSVGVDSHRFDIVLKGGSDLEGRREYPRFLWCGDACLVTEFGDTIDPLINSMVKSLELKIRGLGLPWLVETVPTYRSLAVYVDPWDTCREEVELTVISLAREVEAKSIPSAAIAEIPVCYGGNFGPDLERVSVHTGLGPDVIIRLHSSELYRIYMMGFTPGFPYLGGMDPRLETPRLEDPRTLIPAGSVGIAGKQTGIYPIPSPGGWNIIGRTPLVLFDPARPSPFLLEAGMEIRFVPVSEERFEEILSGNGA